MSAAVAAAVVDCGGVVKKDDAPLTVVAAEADAAAEVVAESMRLNAPFANETVSSSSKAVVVGGMGLLPSSLRAPVGDGSTVGE